MKKIPLSTVACARNKTYDPTKVRVIWLLGGSKPSLARKYARLPNVIVVVIDCKEEIQRYQFIYRQLGVIAISIGDRETLVTLCESGSPAMQSAADYVATMLSREGCGGSPMAAYLAAQRLFETVEFDRFFDRLIEQAFTMTTGRLDLFEHILKCSFCGGVGAGVVAAVISHLQERLSSLDLPVKIFADVLGPLTYLMVSELAGMNAYGTLGHLVHAATTKSEEARRMSIHICLHELPPVGKNRSRRNQLIAFDDEAVSSSEMQEKIIQSTPNYGAAHYLGNLTSREAEFFPPIDGPTIILPAVADVLLVRLNQALQQVLVDTSSLLERTWVETRQELGRHSVESLIARQESRPSPDDLISGLKRTGFHSTFRLLLDLGKDGEYDPQRLDTYFAKLPDSAEQAVRQLSHLGTFLLAIDDEQAAVAADVSDHQDAIREVEAQIRRFFRKAFSQKWGHDAARERLIDASSRLRELSDALLELEAKSECLRLSKAAVLEEQQILNARVTAVRQMLERYVPRGRAAFPYGLVAVESLDLVFAELIQLSARPREEQVTELCRFATCVTLQGLAAIVGAAEPKAGAIAERIVFATDVTVCPPHGGVVRTDSRLKAYALPPTEDEHRGELVKAISDRDQDAIVVFNDGNDSAAHGVTVVRYHVRGFDSIDQLVVGTLKYNGSRLRESATAILRCPTGRDLMPKSDREPPAVLHDAVGVG